MSDPMRPEPDVVWPEPSDELQEAAKRRLRAVRAALDENYPIEAIAKALDEAWRHGYVAGWRAGRLER